MSLAAGTVKQDVAGVLNDTECADQSQVLVSQIFSVTLVVQNCTQYKYTEHSN